VQRARRTLRVRRRLTSAARRREDTACSRGTRDAPLVRMRSIIMRARVPLLAVVGILGCESGYVYSPQSANVVSRSGTPAAKIEVPQERPNGSVQVLSEGIHHVVIGGQKTPVLQVKMTVSNDGDQQPWRVDTSKQLADIPGKGLTAPIYVSTQETGIVEIPIKDKRTIHLYYPLPPGVTNTSKVKQFDLVWTVDTPTRTVASRTTFDRTYPYYNDYYAYGWGYGYGYGPWWGWGPYWGYSATNPGFVYPHVRDFGTVTGPVPKITGQP
jgi:hypothetical protein